MAACVLTGRACTGLYMATALDHSVHIDETETLDSVLQYVSNIRTAAQRNPRFGFDKPWKQFARLMLLLNPQSYGSRMQRYFAEWYGWPTISQREDAGDVWDHGERVEVKVSFITASNTKANFLQIRPWQQIGGYRCFVVDADFTIWRFDLTKTQMAAELRLIGEYAHGTLAGGVGDERREHSVRLPWHADDPNTARWLARYLVYGPTPDQPE